MKGFTDFINNNFNYILISIAALILILIFGIVIKQIIDNKKYDKKIRILVEGPDESMIVGDKKEDKKDNTVYHKERFKSAKQTYREYIYFGGSFAKFIQGIIYGYLIFFILFLAISKTVAPSIVLSFLYFIVFYLYIDIKNTKNRKKFMKSFSMSLRVICSSMEAGNSFQQSIRNIISRDTIIERLRYEYILLDNNLRTNMSIEDAMQLFYERNNMFAEISMFVTIVQFSMAKGDSGMKNILTELQATLEKKLENYAEIDSEIGMYKTVFYVIVFGEVIFAFFIKLMKPEFFIVASTGKGLFKLCGSVILMFLAVYFFKSMIRNAAEA